MTANRVTHSFASVLESVDQAEAVAERFAAGAGLPEDTAKELALVVREAVINAVVHGNGCDPNKQVHIVFERRPGILEIAVRDQGKGFDPATVPDPLAPENLLKPSGRGIVLIRHYMDEVQIHSTDPGTEIRLVKYVRGATADAKEKPQS